jgi:predicted nucleic acid-binding protein
MILADTSVWIDHFRSPEPKITQLVQASKLVMHQDVIGELAMASLADRKLRLRLWGMMPMLPTVALADVLALIESRRLYSRGIGYMDASLLASALLSRGTLVWTRDGKFGKAAQALGVFAEIDD